MGRTPMIPIRPSSVHNNNSLHSNMLGTARTTTSTNNFGLTPRKPVRKHSIVHKLFSVRILLFVSFALPIIIMGATSYGSTSISIRQTTAELTDQISESIILRVREQVTTYFSYTWNFTELYYRELPTTDSVALQAALEPEPLNRMLWKLWQDSFENVVTVYTSRMDGTSDGYYRNTDFAPETFQNFVNTTVGWIGAVDANGYVNTSDPSIYVPTSTLNLLQISWFAEANASSTQFWSDVYFDEITTIGVIWYTCVYPVRDPITNEPVIFLAVDLTSGKLRDYLGSIHVSANAQMWLMEHSGALVAASDKNERTYVGEQTGITYAQDSNLDIVREATSRILESRQFNDSDFTYMYNGEKIKVLVMAINNHNLNLLLVVGYPESDFLRTLTRIQHLILIITSVTFVCSVAIGILVMFMITIPLTKLGKQMDEISNGSFDLQHSNSTKTYLFELRTLERDFLRMLNAIRSFGRFVPVDIVRYLLRNNTEAVAEVVQRDLTVMFSDIKGFTQKTEIMSPSQLSLLLSDYLNSMCAVIGENEGTVDKFIGDAIMALWNVPLPVKNHPLLACECALQQIACLELLNTKWLALGLPEISCRIGIHTGKALVGNLGSKERLAFTAIGDNINLGSRLESLNKKYNTSILVSGEVYELVKHKYLCRYLDVVVVQGRTAPTHLYELINQLENATDQQIQICKSQAEAVTLFLAREFESALDILLSLQNTLPHDTSIRLLIDRTTRAIALGSELPSDWTGCLVFDEK